MVYLASCKANELSASYRTNYCGMINLMTFRGVIPTSTCLKPMQEQQIKEIASL